MTLDALYYPHAIGLNASQVSRLTDNRLSQGYDLIQEMPGGEPAPCFSANQNAEPEQRMSTPSAKKILDAILADANGREIVASMSGGAGVKMYFQKGRPFGIREPQATAIHYAATITTESMIVLDRITCRVNQNLDIDFRLIIGRVDPDTDPIVFTGTSALPAFSCDELYVMGDTLINGSSVPGVTRWTYDTNVTLERIQSAREPSPSWIGVKEYKPRLTIQTNAMSQIATHFQFRGKAYTSAELYAKRRKADNMFYDDVDTEHIKISVKPGLLNITEVDGNPSEVTLDLMPNMDSGDATYRTHIIDTAIAHP